MSIKKYTYIIFLKFPTSGYIKAKIGRTDSLIRRLKQIEQESGMKLVSKKSTYYCADIESDLLARILHEFRYKNGGKSYHRWCLSQSDKKFRRDQMLPA